MKDKFLNYFSRNWSLTNEEQIAIVESMQTKTFRKGTIILKAGQLALNTYFILDGCVREFVAPDDEEKTTNFFTEEQWIISPNNLSTNERSIHNWVCVEDTTVVVGNEEAAQKLFNQFPKIETISRSIMEAAFIEQKKALTTFMTDTPEQRYLKLLKERPSLVQRVPQYYLASYIGIKPESLSRIRKRIANQKD